ncbi:exopolysaccharide biosynthesis polyprenyl glycosylphosphotransferase [Pseudochelatococcus lubricantis]|uniref:exopolysaccharide biosynthesis polyprenyl glycosylphosphotransferase n=1 Tax=Pseudochelatococcus lubricantis TaxID=1538102 RepID=UPI0035E9D62E
MTRWTHGLINRLAMLVDIAMLTAGAVAAHVLWADGAAARSAALCLLQAAIYRAVMKAGGAYRAEYYRSAGRQIRQVAVGAGVTVVAVTVFETALVPGAPSYGAAVPLSMLPPFAALLFGRLAIVLPGMHHLARRAVLRRRVVIVGAVAEVERAISRLNRNDAGLMQCIGVFTDDTAGTGAVADVPVLGRTDDLLTWDGRDALDLVIVALPWDDIVRLGMLIDRLGRLSVDVTVSLTHDAFRPRFAQVLRVGELPTLQVVRQPLKGTLLFAKWIEDKVVAVAGLAVTLPLLLLAALLIRLESPGPVLFRQQRVGRNDRPFTLYKLRTMRVDPVDDGTRGTLRGDARITRVGAILRRTSLDELPQLFNVLEGHMSIVGPRPHVARMDVGGRQYDTVGAYMHRYRMKPGITGWAQINGMRGGIHSLEKAERGVELDLYYVENWSLWLDIKIILLTLTKGMAGSDVF